MEQMAELVKKGIQQANVDLEKENESRLLQEVCDMYYVTCIM